MSGAALIQHAGGMVNAYGAAQAQRENNQLRADLGQKADYLSALRYPFKTELAAGLAEGGALREALAAAGQYGAATGAIDAGVKSRTLGSRTSAMAKRLESESARGASSGYLQAGMGADTEATTMLMQQLLEEMGYSSRLGGKPAVNKYAPYAGMIEGAGDLYGNYSAQDQRNDETDAALEELADQAAANEEP